MKIDVCRVVAVREKSLEKEKNYRSGKKSGNFSFSQGKFEKMIKVREKSGNLRSSKKVHC